MLQARGKSISKPPEIINNCVSKNDVSPLSEKRMFYRCRETEKELLKNYYPIYLMPICGICLER